MKRPSHRALLIAVLALLTAGLAACPDAPPAPTGEAPALDRQALVGVFTTSTASYTEAARSREAVRLDADGTFVRGAWDAAERRFEATPPRHPEVVERWALDAATGTLRFFLDGAEESVPVVSDGPDRWTTVYDGPDGHIEVHYVRQAER